MWQTLYSELRDKDFTILAVAFDDPGPARPWIEQARPDYPCLVDRDHRVAALYHMVNVPQATWIDERGRIVRPAESAGQSDAFRRMDRVAGTMAPELVAERNRAKTAYVEAIRDWVLNGANSANALAPAAARDQLRLPDEKAARGHAHFRLAQHLRARGNEAEAKRHFDEASRLHPESWTIFRQGATKLANGTAAGPEFWARVDALGDRPYHRPVTLKGAP